MDQLGINFNMRLPNFSRKGFDLDQHLRLRVNTAAMQTRSPPSCPATLVFVIDQGRIVEQGTDAELLARDGRSAASWRGRGSTTHHSRSMMLDSRHLILDA
jgi:hypothetical protein